MDQAKAKVEEIKGRLEKVADGNSKASTCSEIRATCSFPSPVFPASAFRVCLFLSFALSRVRAFSLPVA